MGKSVTLRLDDIRAAFHLVAECRELGYDPVLWQTHMAEGLIRLLRAHIVMGGEFRFEHRRPVPVCAVDVGWPSPAHRVRYFAWLSQPDLPDNPQLERFLALPDTNRTCAEGELIPAREWFRCAYLHEVLTPNDIGDGMMSRRTGADGSEHMIVPGKSHTECPHFGPRERALLELFHDELAPHLGTALVTSRDPVSRLPPRSRAVLLCALDGDSEKQIALRLGISTATVHDHVKVLYRHFAVASRPELMAYFLRRGWKSPARLEEK